MASMHVDSSKNGEAYIPVSPWKESAANMPVDSFEEGVAYIPVSPRKQVWPTTYSTK